MNNRLAWRIAVRDSDLDAIAKHVALTLDTYMDRRGLAWPSRSSLAAGTGRAVTTVDRALARLERAEFIVVARSRGRQSNLYSASIPNSSARETVEEDLTVALRPPTVALGPSNSPPSATRSRKELVIRSRTADRSRDQDNFDVDPAALELAHAWLASHEMPA